MKTKVIVILYTVLLTLFTGWILLDAFVIPHSITPQLSQPDASPTPYYNVPVTATPVPIPDTGISPTPYGSVSVTGTPVPVPTVEISPTEIALPSVTDTPAPIPTAEILPTELPSPFTKEPVLTETSYSDAHISIQISTCREYDTNISIAEVYVSDISYLKTAFAKDTYGKNIKQTTSDIAEAHDAIFAVNGDYYGFRDEGFVLRNGVIYRDTSFGNTALAIMSDGSFRMVEEAKTSIYDLYEDGAVQVFSFGPALVRDGEVTFSSDAASLAKMVCNPRTAIGIIETGHYLFLVADGRTDESEGLKFYHLALLMHQYGCVEAYNLDGGGSSTMWFNGQVINQPAAGKTQSSERRVSDIVYFSSENE